MHVSGRSKVKVQATTTNIATLVIEKATTSFALLTLVALSACSPKRIVDFNQDPKEDPKADNAFSAALLVMDKRPQHTFSDTPTGSSSGVTVVVSNQGKTIATEMSGVGSLSNPFYYLGGSYPGVGGTCASTLEPDETCSLELEFAPSTATTSTNTLELSYNNGEETDIARLILEGTGVIPTAILSISESPVFDFGIVAVGSTADKSFVITNTGGIPAVSMSDGAGLAAPFTFKGGSYPGTGGTCTASLAAAATCTVVVSFAPVASSLSADTLLISYDDGTSTQNAERDIQGTGGLANILISDGATYNFGTRGVGSTTGYTFTVSNTGNYIASGLSDGLGLAAPYAFVGGTYPGTSGTCAATLAASATCTVVVNFSPSASGTFNDTLVLAYNNGNGPQTSTRDLTGTASLAVLQISDAATYDYGVVTIGTTQSYTFTVSNTGGYDATSIVDGGTLAAPFAYKDGSYPGTGGTCAATLSASGNCTIVVDFSPVAGGSFNSTIDLSYFDGQASQITSRDVTGTGGGAFLEISDGPTWNYGLHLPGDVVSKTFTVSNSGSSDATSIADAGALAAPFAYLGGTYPGTGGTCAATLAAAANCTIVVDFSPVAVGNFTDTIDLSYDNGTGAANALRAVEGEASLAILAISDNPTYDYGIRASGSVTSYTFTLSNIGGIDATSIADTAALAAPFAFKGGSYPGTGGTCGASLAAGADCTLVVDFSPVTTGSFSDTIDLSYDDGVSTQNVLRNVVGESVTAILSISDGPTYDYGGRVLATTTTHSFTVTNSGGLLASSMMDAGGLAAPYTFKGGIYPGTGGTCGGTLAAGADCTIVVDFTPVAAGTFNDTIDISYSDGANSQNATRDITGKGGTAVLEISDGATFDYGPVGVSLTASHTFTVTNTGALTASSIADAALMAAPFAYKGGSYPGTGGDCNTSLAPAASCLIVVDFSPSSAGLFADTIELSYNDGSTTVSSFRALEGTGALAELTISDGPTYDYGVVVPGGNATHTFTVTNTGALQATAIADGSGLASPYSFQGGTYPGTGGTCGTTLNAAATCTVVVDFDPASVGSYTDTLIISYNDSVNAQTAERAIDGESALAVLSISDGPTHDFGNLVPGQTTSHTFTVANTGGMQATSLADAGGLAAPFTYQGGSYPGTGGTCGATLNVAASCTIVVDFSPASVATFNDTIDLSYFDGGSNQNSTRDITGDGALAVLAISDGPSYDYSVVIPGNTASHTFIVSNTGGNIASLVADAGGLAAPFNYKGGAYPGTGGDCGASLAPSATCTIIVDFAPLAAGAYSDTIDLEYNDGLATQNATRDIQGSGAAGTLTISDAPSYDYASVLLNTTVSHTFTVTNAGALAASSIADGGGIAAPFAYKGGSYPGTGGDCGSSLDPAESCTIVVDFTPTSQGNFLDTLVINYWDGSANQSLNEDLNGEGVKAVLTISEAPTYNFGMLVVGASAENTFTITNTGGYDAASIADAAALAAPFAYKGGTYPGTGGDCGTDLAAAATCSIVLEFTPASDTVYSDTLEINYNDGTGSVTLSLGLNGSAGLPAELEITDAPSYDYGSVDNNTLASRTFTITNIGGVDATSITDAAGLAAPFNYKGGSYPGTGGDCAATLSASASCTIVVDFSPVASGAFIDTLLIDYNDGLVAQQLSLDLNGTGVNTAPVATNLSITLYKNTSNNTVTLAATDLNLDTLTYSIVSGPTNGSLASDDGDNLITYSPTTNFTGSDSFTFKANDGTVDSNTATVSITVENWWNTSWKRRRLLTIDNSSISSNLTNFPVLVKIDSSRIDYAQTKAAGADLRFVDADHTTSLSFEIESWDPAGTSWVWVKVPQIDSSSNTDHIYMYYGNTAATDGQNAAGVWSNGYLAVYHMNQSPTSGATINDSTGNGRDMIVSGTGLAQDAASIAGAGILFTTGSSSYLSASTSAWMSDLSAFTVSAWTKAVATGTETGWFSTNTNHNGPNGNDGKMMSSRHSATSNRIISSARITGGETFVESSNNAQTTNWQHVAFSWASGGTVNQYFDGAFNTPSAAGTARTGTTTNVNAVDIGMGNKDKGGTTWNGLLDEIRISSVARSADWIRAEEMSSSDSFYLSYGSEIAIP